MNLFVGETIISNNSRRNILENRVPSSKFNSSSSSPDPANLYSRISKFFSRTKETRERGEEIERERERRIESGSIDRIGERLNRFVRKLKSQVAN